MSISEDNKRISVKLTKKEFEYIKELSEKDSRSISNYLYKIIKEYLLNNGLD